MIIIERAHPLEEERKIPAISLFAGVGGLDLGVSASCPQFYQFCNSQSDSDERAYGMQRKDVQGIELVPYMVPPKN